MPDLTGLDGLRDALEALDAERADVERSNQEPQSSAFVNRNEDFRALRSPANRGAPAGMIARLELGSVGPWERLASLLAESAVALTRSATTGVRLPVRADPVTVADYSEPWPQPSPTTPETPDNDYHWVDPDPYAAMVAERKMLGHILGGRYRLERQLGRGGMGTVYLASDLEAGESPFAVKVLRPEFGSFSEALAMLRAEVRVTRMLRHPHIARVYSLNADRLDVYLVTEYFQGRTLDAHLLEIGQGLPVNEARPLLVDVCAALAYAHGLEVVHGDLKPSKVFITPSGRARLLDFGIARAARTRNGRFDPLRVGGLTMAYNSSEMLEGHEPDPRDDVYSLACMIYRVLSGAHPFDARSAVEARRLGLAMGPLRVLSRDQNAALARALAFGRAQRTPSVTALLGSLGWGPETSAFPPSFAIDPAAVSGAHAPPPTVMPPATAAPAPAVPTAGTPAPALAVPAAATPAPAPAVPAAATPTPALAVPTAATPAPALAVATAGTPAPARLAAEAAIPDSEASATAISIPAPTARAAPRIPARPRLPAIKRTGRAPPAGVSRRVSSRPPLPSIKSTPRALPAASVSRRYLMPALIVLFLVAVAIGIALVYRGHLTAVFRSRTASTRPPAGASGAPAALPPAGPAAIPPAAAPPIADTKHSVAIHSSASIPVLRPLPEAAAAMADSENCPYPRIAVDQGLTGTVFLLVDVATNGSPVKAKIGKTSGSEALDQAAVSCVEQFGRFPSPTGGSSSGGYWGRMHITWSFGT